LTSVLAVHTLWSVVQGRSVVNEHEFMSEQVESVEYEKPSIVDYGDLRELTRAASGTFKVDHSFVTNQTATFLSH
jgi:hypothetical protein